MTFIQAVNIVLIKLREVTASSVDESAYIKLIGQFVNEAMKDVQDSWNWTALRTGHIITTVAGTSVYEIPSSSKEGYVLFMQHSNGGYLRKVSWKWLTSNRSIDDNSTGQPIYWSTALPSVSSSNEIKIAVWPEPDSVENISVFCKTPQAQFSLDGTDDDTEITLDSHAIILGAFIKALDERGDDGSNLLKRTGTEYDRALSNAIAYDVSLTSGEDEWQVR